MAATVSHFEQVLGMVGKIPYGSATEQFFNWANQLGIGSKSVLSQNTDFKFDFSHGAIQQTLARLFAISVLSRVATLGALYNFAAFAARFTVACVGHIRQENRDALKKEFNAAFTHLLTAVYDLAVGILLNTSYIYVLAAVAFSLFHTMAWKGHEMFFVKAKQPLQERAEVSEFVDIQLPPINHHSLQASCAIARGGEQLAKVFIPDAPADGQHPPSLLKRVSGLFFTQQRPT